ncbi:MAG: condensation domain-containing protein, partial [Saprospiraceae bacterium]
MQLPEQLPIYDLTQSQTLIWAGQMLDRETPMYNMAMRFDLQGAIDEAAFQLAFQTLVAKSEVLRTIVTVKNGVPRQQILPQVDFSFPIIDLSNATEQAEQVKAWLTQHTTQILDLNRCNFSSALLKLSPTHYVWFFNQHHLFTDGWSLTVLFQTLAGFYQKALNNDLENVSDIPSFQDYLAYEKK